MTATIILLVALILLSAFFAGAEISFFSLSDAKVQALVQKGVPGALKVKKIKENPDKLLITILVGNNIVNITASSIATVLATDIFGSKGTGIAIGVMTLLVLFFGEITPKSFASRYAPQVACHIAWLVQLIQTILSPISWSFVQLNTILKKRFTPQNINTIPEEIKALSKMGLGDGTIDKHEETFIRNVLQFNTIQAQQVMVPRVKVKAIEENTTLSEILKENSNKMYSRYPVFSHTIDSIEGLLYIRDILQYSESDLGKIHAKDIMRKALFSPKTTFIDDLFNEMRLKKTHMVILTDEFGGTSGIITLEDILEELVGEINDEKDPTQILITEKTKNSWCIKSNAEIKAITEQVGITFDRGNTSIAKYILEKLERMPLLGEKIDEDGYIIEVTQCSPQKIEEILLTKKENTSNKN